MAGLDDVTPLVLTWNEEANIARTLSALEWAREVVILDSGSCDRTREFAAAFPNVRWETRPFDAHAAQWRHGVHHSGIRTDYVLALDADYQVPRAFVDELESRFLRGDFAGGVAGFEYHVRGRRLWGTLYPAKIVVFRRADVDIAQAGHTQEVGVRGATYRFTSRLIHDDRKSAERFAASQARYAALEADRLAGQEGGRWQDSARRWGLMPYLVGPGSYFLAGGPFTAGAARQYARERVAFERLLARELSKRRQGGAA
jgi:glycosyltransferase involved in cell wall biosynthesis